MYYLQKPQFHRLWHHATNSLMHTCTGQSHNAQHLSDPVELRRLTSCWISTFFHPYICCSSVPSSRICFFGNLTGVKPPGGTQAHFPVSKRNTLVRNQPIINQYIRLLPLYGLRVPYVLESLTPFPRQLGWPKPSRSLQKVLEKLEGLLSNCKHTADPVQHADKDSLRVVNFGY